MRITDEKEKSSFHSSPYIYALKALQAAQAAFANDVQSGHAKATTSSSVSVAPKPAAPKASTSGGLYANYTTAKDLGIAQEEEKLAAEALALQQSQGVVGQWEVIDVPKSSTQSNATIPQKRYHQEDEDEEGEGFRVRRKKLAVGLGEIYDPGQIVLEPKGKQKEEIKPESKDQPQTSIAGQSGAPLLWSKKRWKMDQLEPTGGDEAPEKTEAGEEQKVDDTITKKEELKGEASEDGVKKEPQEQLIQSAAESNDASEQTQTAPATSMFKKRKAPSQPVGAKKGARKQL
ncbi:13025_t:CDS:2 [Acaulospora colombiana]|uniref:13025_t:CDS:1 n=1 Tax=Acaulospora colombiana TaxID=27376 RepID=A0ACA9P0W0_9GLOM|nr:13025_t:CDS:2 [Acaulospora colombiana]